MRSHTASVVHEPSAPAHARSRWALRRGVHDLATRFRDDWRRLPRGRVWRAAAILLAGQVLCILASVGLSRWACGWDGLQAWDERWLLAVERSSPMRFPDAILLESPGNLSYLIPLTITVSVIAIRRGRPLVALAIQLAYWGQRPIVVAGWMAWDRPRPTLIADGVAAPGLHAFPSGHAALCVAVYGLLAYLWVRSSRSAIERVLAVVLCTAVVAIVSVARVRLGSHWPSDILAGAGLGVAWLAAVIVALRYAKRGGARVPEAAPGR